ncbi:MAG: ATP-binding protein, partial [Bacteroides sp.]|nr:ATP-binding protein [Bacteroides sp.]
KRARNGNGRKPELSRQHNLPPFKPFTVEVWDGKDVEQVVCLYPPEKPPSVICFNDNINDTLKFFRRLNQLVGSRKVRDIGVSNWIIRKHNRLPRIKRYIGFEEIEVLSTAPALILAAVYERAKVATGEVPPAINFPNWSPQAFQTLYEIGFFEIVGHAPAEKIREVYVEKLDSSYKVSKTITGKNADGLEQASDVVLELLNYLSVDQTVAETLIKDINSAVSEAMINVARHAYREEFVAQSTKVCLKQWWMSARADRSANTLTIAVYDQGETIPGTLPKREWYQETVEKAMRSVIPDFVYASQQRTIDHEFINYSMKKGRTQTGESRRGLGLPQMQDLIEACPDGTLSILSRQGLYMYGKNVGVYKQRLDLELEGTLVEWKLTLPKGKT